MNVSYSNVQHSIRQEISSLLRLAGSVGHAGADDTQRTGALRLARTIGDLAGLQTLLPAHVAEAIRYRSLDRQLWV